MMVETKVSTNVSTFILKKVHSRQEVNQVNFSFKLLYPDLSDVDPVRKLVCELPFSNQKMSFWLSKVWVII